MFSSLPIEGIVTPSVTAELTQLRYTLFKSRAQQLWPLDRMPLPYVPRLQLSTRFCLTLPPSYRNCVLSNSSGNPTMTL